MEDFKFTHDLYNSDLRSECYDIKTKYEEMFASKGEKIKYLRFRFKKKSIGKSGRDTVESIGSSTG